MKNLARDVESIALALSEEGGYEYYRIDDDLRELAKDVSDMQAENAKLRELAAGIGHLLFKLDVDYCATCPRDDINHPCPVYTVKGGDCLYETDLRELGVEVTDG